MPKSVVVMRIKVRIQCRNLIAELLTGAVVRFALTSPETTNEKGRHRACPYGELRLDVEAKAFCSSCMHGLFGPPLTHSAFGSPLIPVAEVTYRTQKASLSYVGATPVVAQVHAASVNHEEAD